MAKADDTTKALPGKPQQVLGQLIEAQRAKLLQAHAVMTCLREVLLYAKAEAAVIYAEAANAAAVLANEVAEGLDSVALQTVLHATSVVSMPPHRTPIEIWPVRRKRGE